LSRSSRHADCGLPRVTDSVFYAEVYLRQVGERLLDDADQQQPGHWAALRAAAAALVGVGAIGADLAWRVVDDYATANHIRSGKLGFVHFAAPPGRREAEGLPPRQFRVIDQEISVGGARVLVRDLAITADGATLRYRRYSVAPAPGQVRRMLRGPGAFPWNATPPQIVDSAGHRPEVRFGDGGRDGEGHHDGELELHGTIAPNAAWLEIDGVRVDLHGHTTSWAVRIEALAEQSRVERLLWRHLAVVDPRSGETNDLEPMIEALVAAGGLQEGSPLVNDVRAVTARMPRRPLHERRIRRANKSGVVEPWGSLLDRLGAGDGPEWTLVLGAVTPSCDGVQFAANAITSDSDGVEVEVDVAPHVLTRGALDELPVAWWARDDRDNHYLGIPTGGGVRGDSAQGTLRYWPALDPHATRLDLLMCVDSHQAVVSLSLPGRPEDSQ
jgi:hypothetical protein